MAARANGEHNRTGEVDYYRLLQIDPDAPHELIAEAYWFLASRLRAEQSIRRSAEKELQALNDAYAALAGPAQRAAYDATQPQVPALRRMRAERAASTATQQSFLSRLLKKSPDIHRLDYYELLCLDPAADSPLVARAYSIMRTLHSRQALPDDRYMADLSIARDTLLDPQRRAEYDRQRAQASTTVVDKRTEETGAGASAKAPVERESTESKVAASSTAVASVEAEAPAPVRDRKPSRTAVVARKTASTIARIVAACGRALARGVVAGARRIARGSALVLNIAANGVRAISAASNRRRQSQPTRVEETPPDLPDRRQLRERIPAPYRAEDSENLCLARLHIVDAKGTRQVDLGNRPMVLGSGIDCDVALEPQNGVAAEHAQIWCADGRFLVRSLSPIHQTLVNGQRINWALLEDGDEIEIGRCRIRFEADSLPSFLTTERDSIKLTEDVPERANQ